MVESSSSQRRRRTLALASVVAAYVLSFFQRFAPAGIATDLAAAFNTSASSLGGVLQPLVGRVMDRSWQGGLSSTGARLFTPEDFHGGLLLLAAVAAFGAVATWWIRETGCRNIWKPPM